MKSSYYNARCTVSPTCLLSLSLLLVTRFCSARSVLCAPPEKQNGVTQQGIHSQHHIPTSRGGRQKAVTASTGLRSVQHKV